jgi:hypothetical protein
MERSTTMERIPVAIDPVALLLPTRLYLIWVELHHPNTPFAASLAKALEKATPEERATVARQAEAVQTAAEAVRKAATAGVHA